jgi:serine/threonine protein kinase
VNPGSAVNGYVILQPFTTAGGGQGRWTFARRGGKDYFLKEFLSPTFPDSTSPGSEAVKARKRERCHRFEAHHQTIFKALRPLSRDGGNLVVTVAFFRVGPRYYKVTEKVDVASISLAEIARLPLKRKLVVLLAVTGSVRILHKQRLVHGDIKPDNILLEHAGPEAFRARLIDFDNCFFAELPPAPDELVGSVTYYSPELMAYVVGEGGGDALEPRSDVFALGLVFAQYLSGDWPLASGGSYQYAADAGRAGQRLSVQRGDLPAALADLVDLMLQADPAQRPTSDQVYTALKQVQSGRSAGPGSAATVGDEPGSMSRLRGSLRTKAAPSEETAGGAVQGRLRGSLRRSG